MVDSVESVARGEAGLHQLTDLLVEETVQLAAHVVLVLAGERQLGLQVELVVVLPVGRHPHLLGYVLAIQA